MENEQRGWSGHSDKENSELAKKHKNVFNSDQMHDAGHKELIFTFTFSLEDHLLQMELLELSWQQPVEEEAKGSMVGGCNRWAVIPTYPTINI